MTSRHKRLALDGLIAIVVLGALWILASCTDQAVEPQRTMTVTFDTVPHEYYSRDTARWLGVNILSTIQPVQGHRWCLEAGWYGEQKCDYATPGNQGGHRFYLQRDANWFLRYRTTGEFGGEWLHFWSWRVK